MHSKDHAFGEKRTRDGSRAGLGERAKNHGVCDERRALFCEARLNSRLLAKLLSRLEEQRSVVVGVLLNFESGHGAVETWDDL